MDYIYKYQQWIENENIDNKTKKELLELKGNHNEIEERFYKDLEFGTGGVRGLIGAGSNRINIYTIRKLSQGLSNYLNNINVKKNKKSVVIAYDSRHYSKVFALQAALVLAGNDIKVYIFENLRPTPELSFAVRYLNCDSGIVITASHNPAEYNGFKVYGSDGSQITLSVANQITNELENIDFFKDINLKNEVEALESELISYIGTEIDEKYLDEIIKSSMKYNKTESDKNLKIVYTPLHGSGLELIEKALVKKGYKKLYIVESQKKPDGNFPTVKAPNPEEKEALKDGIKLSKQLNADIVIATDPDADRVGVAIKDTFGKYILLTGNEVGALLTDYIISNSKRINKNDVLIKTIVTSDFGKQIAKEHGVKTIETLTGFKFIGEKIREFEENKLYNFLFGYEESYGYLADTCVRDKDAIMATLLIVDMAQLYKLKGMSLIDRIEELYKQYSYYVDEMENYFLKGIEGKAKINFIVDKFRNVKNIISEIDGIAIVEDYKLKKRFNISKKITEEIELPASNVIKIHLQDESWFAIRPSGTEPKLKVYYSIKANNKKVSLEKMNYLKNKVSSIIRNII